jgi:hypothetical protein
LGKDATPIYPPPAPSKPTDAKLRRCARMLRMVSELHKRGYQHLRVMPFLHDGNLWRLAFGPRKDFSRLMGLALVPATFDRAPQYSSASQSHAFGWKDAGSDDARELAAKMISRFPDLMQQCQDRDWAYVGWFAEMMGWVESGRLPYVNPMEPKTGLSEKPLTLTATPFLMAEGPDAVSSRCPLPPPGGNSGSPIYI